MKLTVSCWNHQTLAILQNFCQLLKASSEQYQVILALVLALATASALANSNGTSSPPPSSLGHPGRKIYVMSKFENVDTSGPAVSPAVVAHGRTSTKSPVNGTHRAVPVPAIGTGNLAPTAAGTVRTKRQYGPRGNYGRPQPRPSRYYQRDPYRYRPQPYGRRYYWG